MPLEKMREFERRRKFLIIRDEGVRERQKAFVEKDRKLKSCRENEETKKIRRKRNGW